MTSPPVAELTATTDHARVLRVELEAITRHFKRVLLIAQLHAHRIELSEGAWLALEQWAAEANPKGQL